MHIIVDFLTWVQRVLQAIVAGVADRARVEPIGTATIIRLGLYTAAAFGLDWTGEQIVVFAAFAEGVTLWYARQEVKPISKLPDAFAGPEDLSRIDVNDEDIV